MIFDTHPHVISDDKSGFPAAPLGGKSSSWSEKTSMPYARMIQSMDAAGVARAVLVQAATYYGYDNRYVAAAIAAHPDRLSGICTIDALAPDAPATLQKWVDAGFCGVRLFVSGTSLPTDATWFSSAESYPFWDKARDIDLPVCLQIAANAVPQVKDIALRYPQVRILLDHLARPDLSGGAPYPNAEALFGLADLPNVYFKFTPVNARAITEAEGDKTAFVARLVAAFGAGRLTWGSNFPSTTATLLEALAMCRHAMRDLGSADQEQIFCKTAQRIYPVLATMSGAVAKDLQTS